jgi:hypothetical protein
MHCVGHYTSFPLSVTVMAVWTLSKATGRGFPLLSSVNGYEGSEETLRERKRWAPSGFTNFS